MSEQMIKSWKRPKGQDAFPLTSTELESQLAYWKKEAKEAKDKLERLDASICAAIGHGREHEDYYSRSWCGRCGEQL